jgi:uncharacterized protein
MQRKTWTLAQIGIIAALLAFVHLGRTVSAQEAQRAKEEAKANRLAKETSPYLLLHAHNPVDWYPWGPEAFAKAKDEKKPIFLSVGYSSCYWCHVMERESFVDTEIAKVLNDNYVCIKVDREERPDVDQIYMIALQATRQGGWPMSMFLTSDGRPFFGGSYFPPRDHDGVSGFLTVITEVAKAWDTQKPSIEKSANALTEIVKRRLKSASGQRKLTLTRAWPAQGRAALAQQFDQENGGFGFNRDNPRRPKFPQPVDLFFLLDQHRRGASSKNPTDPLNMVLLTLDRMARGGIRDHLGGGYHRYSTDRYWLVPHFEKMLYDNAQLASIHLLAFELTQDPRWRAEAEATFAFIERTMTSDEGGFYSSLDAETKGEEGAYYVWTPSEVKAVLGEKADADLFAEVYGLTGDPNFERARYVLHEPRTRAEQAEPHKTTAQELEGRLAPLRAQLLAARQKRAAPLCDDKVITGWNGLMIAAYADGYRLLKVEKYRQAAEKAAGFVVDKLRTTNGRLLRTTRLGKAKLPAYLEDYAFFIYGLLRLHAATGNERWLREAQELADRMIRDFEDREEGGFFFTADDHESLLARPKDPFDNALPSGNSMAILDLMALHKLTGESSYLEHAGKAIDALSAMLFQNPAALPLTLVGLQLYLDAAPDRVIPKTAVPGALAEAPAQVVTAGARLADAKAAAIAPGSEFDAVVTATIRNGWHIYGNPTGLPELKPTTLALVPQLDRSVTLVKVSYPIGDAKILGSLGTEQVALYEGKVEFTARLKLAADAKPGPIRLRFLLSFQSCNDRLCMAPAKMMVPLNVSASQ